MTDKLAETIRASRDKLASPVEWSETIAAAIREKFTITEKPAPDPLEVLGEELRESFRGDWKNVARHVRSLLDAEWDAAIDAAESIVSYHWYFDTNAIRSKIRDLKRARP